MTSKLKKWLKNSEDQNIHNRHFNIQIYCLHWLYDTKTLRYIHDLALCSAPVYKLVNVIKKVYAVECIYHHVRHYLVTLYMFNPDSKNVWSQ